MNSRPLGLSFPWFHALAAWMAWLALCVLAALGSSAQAQSYPEQDRGALQVALQQWLAARDADGESSAGTESKNQQNPSNLMGQQALDAAPQIEVELGELDSRLRLAPCARIKAYLPRGANLWGRSRIGLRCEEGARWNVFWPVTVKVWAPALTVARTVPAGDVLQAEDLTVARVDLASGGSPAMRHLGEVVGRTLARTLTQGAEVREADLKVRRWFTAGEPVRLIVKGSGFQAAATATALAHGDEGRCARVRVGSGRILCAQPVAEGLAELAL